MDVTPPGFRVRVQVPVAGRSFNTTLPVAVAQVGCVIIPTSGTAGIAVTEMLSVRAVLNPHELFAVTEIVPPVKPAVAVIDVEVELPLHPEGNVHV